MCGIAAQAEIAITDVIKFIVEGLQDQTGLAAAMLYCTSLSELRDQMMTYEKTRKECTQPKRPDGACFGCWSTDHQYAQCPKRKMTTTIAAVQDDESLGETNEDELAAVHSR
ncbi:hypothetical protein ACLKA6_010422 [Drosophila palustris]